MKKTFITLLVIVFAITKIYSQSEIFMLDGKKIITDDVKTDTTDYISYKTKSDNYKSVVKYDIFSVITNGKTDYYYVPDSSAESFTADQMHDFVRGRYEGRTTKAPLCLAGGILIGIAGPMSFPLVGLTFLSPILPAGYDVLVGVAKVKDNKISIPDEYAKNPYYIEGYKTSVKKKRINNAIIGSLIGLAVGLTASYFVFDVK